VEDGLQSCPVQSDPDRLFAFEAKAAGLRVARWEYRLDPTSVGCRVTETWTDQRGKLAAWLGGPVSGTRDRPGHNRAGIVTTLSGLLLQPKAHPLGEALMCDVRSTEMGTLLTRAGSS